jgi:hypothetical protein
MYEINRNNGERATWLSYNVGAGCNAPLNLSNSEKFNASSLITSNKLHFKEKTGGGNEE